MTSLAVPGRARRSTASAVRAGGRPLRDLGRMVDRLAAGFPALDRPTVERQVSDTWNCVLHLDADVTLEIVEELAREHLAALNGSRDLIRPGRHREVRRPDAL